MSYTQRPPNDPSFSLETNYESSINDAFSLAQPERFINLSRSVQQRDDLDESAILTYRRKDGLVLSAISDRSFMRRLLLELMPLRGRRIFEIGSGLGHLSSVMAELCGSGGEVCGCEIIDDLYLESQKNAFILGRKNLHLFRGDFVDVIGHCGIFDVIVGTSCFSQIHKVLFDCLSPHEGLLAFPIEIPGGGDCMTIFKRQGTRLETTAAMMSVSVPTTGAYTEKPIWAIPVRDLFPLWDKELKTTISIGGEVEGYSFRETLSFRSNLFFHEVNFVAVNLSNSNSQLLHERDMAFGLISDDRLSVCLQHGSNLILRGAKALDVAQRFVHLKNTWLSGGRHSLAGYRYAIDIGTLAVNGFKFNSGYGADGSIQMG